MNSKCEKCKDAPGVHRYHFGYVAIEGGSRWKRYYYLCIQCLENAEITNKDRQHPLWYAVTDGDNIRLKDSGRSYWPEEEKDLPGR